MEKVAVADVVPEAVTASAEASVVVMPLNVSEMLTVPVRLPVPVMTFTVKVTFCPNPDGLGLDVTMVFVEYTGIAVPTSSISSGECGAVPDGECSPASIMGVSWVLLKNRGNRGSKDCAHRAVRILVQGLAVVSRSW